MPAPRQNNTIRSSAAAGGVRSTDGVVFPFQIEPAALGFDLAFWGIGENIYSVSLLHVGASVISLAATFFKSQSALIPLLLLPNRNPAKRLRFAFGYKSRGCISFVNRIQPRNSKHFACDQVMKTRKEL